MTTASHAELMARYNQLGRLLPAADDLDSDDPATIATVELVISEMAKVQAEMDTWLAKRRSAW